MPGRSPRLSPSAAFFCVLSPSAARLFLVHWRVKRRSSGERVHSPPVSRVVSAGFGEDPGPPAAAPAPTRRTARPSTRRSILRSSQPRSNQAGSRWKGVGSALAPRPGRGPAPPLQSARRAVTPTCEEMTVSPTTSTASAASSWLIPAAMKARCAAPIVSAKHSAAQGTVSRTRSSPGLASSSVHSASAWLRALRRQSSGSGAKSMRAAISSRQARRRSSREEIVRYRAEVATPSRAATPASVKSATPSARAAATTSARVKPGLGPVGRPSRVMPSP